MATAATLTVTATATNMVHSLDYYYTRYWQEYGDPRWNKSTLMAGGPWQMLTVTMTYLIAVTLFGPYVMKKRKPIDNLIWPIRFYNAFMVVFNTYLFFNFSYKLNWGLDCWAWSSKSMQRLDQAGLVLWELTLLSRYFDFFDSLFFVCRKKFSHLSVLHVAHHTLVPIIVWFAGKFEPTPIVVFAGYINLPIHMIMYTYYCLSTFPKLRQYLWWKKYLTTIQIIQFCVDLVHSLQVVYYPFHNYHTMTYIQTAFSVTFLYLFCQFYLRSYMSRSKQNTLKTDKQSMNGACDNNNESPIRLEHNFKKIN